MLFFASGLKKFPFINYYFMEPGDQQDTPLNKILHFIWSVGLLKGWNREGMHSKSRWLWCKGRSGPAPYSFICLLAVTILISYILTTGEEIFHMLVLLYKVMKNVLYIHFTCIQFIWLSCEHSNEPLGYVKGWEYLAFISDCYRIKEGSPSIQLSSQISKVQRNSL